METELFKVAFLDDLDLYMTRSGIGSKKFGYAIHQNIKDVLEAFNQESDKHRLWDVQIGIYREGNNFGFLKEYYVPEKIALLVRNLNDDAKEGFKESFELGRKVGQDLLFQLNEGSLSLQDFNEQIKK